MLRTKIALITAAILCTAVAHAGSITAGTGSAGSSSASTSSGIAGAFTIGIANKFLEPLTGAVLGKILVLIFIILFIQKRPRGLFAVRGRAVES